MDQRTKLIGGSIGVLILFLLGNYVASVMFSLLVDQTLNHTSYVGFIVDYIKYFNASEYSAKFHIAAVLGFAIPFVIIGGIWYRFGSPSSQDVYGKARFANFKEIEKVFLKEETTSIIVGKMNGKYLKFNGQQFLILAAPTRSGKGVGLVIPNLLYYYDSVVVLDVKGENYELTSGFRQQKLKQNVYVFNPFAEDYKGHRWNPLSYVSSNPDLRVSDLMSIASMFYSIEANPKNAFWLGQAQGAFLAFALYLFDKHKHDTGLNLDPPPPTIGALYRLSTGNGSDFQEYLQGLASAPFLGREAKQAFSGLLSQAKETFANILATFKEPLLPWLNPIVDAATSGDDFLLTDVRKKRMTIYVVISPNKLAEARLIINLFFSQLINLNTKELPKNNPELKHQCLLLMDEFTSIGQVDIIAKSVSYMAGYNMRLFPIIQSVAQLDATYGKEMSRTLMTNHALQIMYTPREQQDANDYSEMLGYTTIKKTGVSKSSRDKSETENEERRALMLPQELKSMANTKEIFIFEGIDKPVMCDKIRYYEDPIFTKRLLDQVALPTLTISRHE